MTREQREMVRELRLFGQSYGRISKKLGVSVNTIKSYCQRSRIPVGEAYAKAVDMAVCGQCGKPLIQGKRGRAKRFCCDDCRRAWWKAHDAILNRKAYYHLTCAGCGREFDSYGNSGRKYCSHACYIKNRFRGGEANDPRAV
jgi:endogenous inhibitor of DNA gyrase (YacG/DUF329 family)